MFNVAFKWTDALTGAHAFEDEEYIFLAGGQNQTDQATNLISKVKKVDPTAIEKVGFMKVPRVDAFFFRCGDKRVIIGGSEKPLMEVFNTKMEPLSGYEAKSEAFFYQLACYTSDLKLANCSYG